MGNSYINRSLTVEELGRWVHALADGPLLSKAGYGHRCRIWTRRLYQADVISRDVYDQFLTESNGALMKANMDIEQWHHKWRMLPAQVPGTGAVIECVDCQHQLASYDSEKGFGHARGCTVAEGVPQFPWDDLRVALICSGVVLPPSAP